MAIQYKNPGVYVVEKDAFGSNIVANATAVPIFIGFTEKAEHLNGEKLPKFKNPGQKPPLNVEMKIPYKVNSILEYSKCFGGPDITGTLEVTEEGHEEARYYKAEIQKDDQPYVPGYMHPAITNYLLNGGGSCYVISLGEYSAMEKENVNIEAIINAIQEAELATLILPIDLLRFGSANYYNWCNQLIDHCVESKKLFCVLDVIMHDKTSSVLNEADISDYRDGITSAYLKYAAAYYPYLKSLTPYAYDKNTVKLNGKPLNNWEDPNNGKAQEVKAFLASNYIPLPPSPFMAGIFSRIDNSSGVWTPPANVAPTGVTGPVVNITHHQQENFNVDPITGKSINAFRSFNGKGTLVWGARTNDGNSMDWRYINVVRLFISIETDISKALEAFVSKPNVHNTWVEAKTMIDSYLFGLFNAGAFAGTTPESSYWVSIGVGETMTEEDVRDGHMRARILVAPVRPAQFIELTFSQMIG